MTGRTRFGRDVKKINFSKIHKGQDIVESHDRLHTEGTQHIEGEDSRGI